MEKTRKIQSIIQDVIEGRKDNNEATIDILALCDVSQHRELLESFLEHVEDTVDFLPCEPSVLIDDYLNSL